jgi:hypothetical protein
LISFISLHASVGTADGFFLIMNSPSDKHSPGLPTLAAALAQPYAVLAVSDADEMQWPPTAVAGVQGEIRCAMPW